MSDTYPEVRSGTAPALENMSAGQAARFGVSLCSALLETESERGFHGALYPANLTYTDDGRVLLGAPLKLRGEFSPEEIEYLPPELFWSGDGGPATDVYAVGLLLYAACSSGRPAFTGESGELSGELRATAATRRLKGEALREPKEAGDELAQVILRALAYREEERWPDVESLRCALEDCCEFASSVEKPRDGGTAAAAGTAATGAVTAAAAAASAGDKVPTAAEPQAAPEIKPEQQAKPTPEIKAAPEAKAKPETKPQSRPAQPSKPAQQPKAAQKPSRKKDAGGAVPDGHPRPVYDVFNEKKSKKKSTVLPVLATILALVVILLAVLYFVRGGDEPGVEPTPTPPVSSPVTPDDGPEPGGMEQEPGVEPTPVIPEPTPETSPEPTPEPSDEPLSVSLTELGSASRDSAAALCAAQGGHLPILRDEADLHALIAEAEAVGVSYVWLDAKRGADGVWRTSAGEALTYLPWFSGEPSGTDNDGTAEDCLMLWKYNGVWGLNDMREDPGTAYARYYGGRIAVFCQIDS